MKIQATVHGYESHSHTNRQIQIFFSTFPSQCLFIIIILSQRSSFRGKHGIEMGGGGFSGCEDCHLNMFVGCEDAFGADARLTAGRYMA